MTESLKRKEARLPGSIASEPSSTQAHASPVPLAAPQSYKCLLILWDSSMGLEEIKRELKSQILDSERQARERFGFVNLIDLRVKSDHRYPTELKITRYYGPYQALSR